MGEEEKEVEKYKRNETVIYIVLIHVLQETLVHKNCCFLVLESKKPNAQAQIQTFWNTV